MRVEIAEWRFGHWVFGSLICEGALGRRLEHPAALMSQFLG
jgi:hypothetical protein